MIVDMESEIELAIRKYIECEASQHIGLPSIHTSFYDIGIQESMGRKLKNCEVCHTTQVGDPIIWVSPSPEDYIPGHEFNVWGAF